MFCNLHSTHTHARVHSAPSAGRAASAPRTLGLLGSTGLAVSDVSQQWRVPLADIIAIELEKAGVALQINDAVVRYSALSSIELRSVSLTAINIV